MGTIAEKLTYLDETREKIRKGINSIGGNLTNTDTFRSYSDALDGIYEKFPKVTGTGSSISLSDTTKGRITSELQGNTSQASTPTPDSPIPVNVVSGGQEVRVVGKNLFDGTYTNAYIGGSNGRTFTLADNTRTAIVRVQPNTTYTITKFNNTGVGNRFIIFDYPYLLTTQTDMGSNHKLYELYDETITTKTITTTSTGNYLYVYVTSNTSNIPYLQIEVGSTATEYEAYTGKSYEINLGKNILNVANESGTGSGITYSLTNNVLTYSGTASGSYFNIGSFQTCYLPAGTYTFSIDKATTNNERIVLYTQGTTNQNFIIQGGNKSITVVLNDIKTNWRIGISNLITNSQYSGTLKLQLEKGSIATTYTPYKTPIELCKIGDYKDFIKKGTGKNLYDTSKFIQGTWQDSSTNTRIVGFLIPTKAGQKYRVTLRNNELDFAIGNTTKNEQSGNTQVQSDSGWKSADYTYTITGDGYLFLQVKKRYGGNLPPSDLSVTDFQVELGETASSFEPYGYKDKWYIEKNIGKGLVKPTSASSIEENGLRTDITLTKPYQAYPLLFSNYFTRASSYDEAVNRLGGNENKIGLNTNGVVLCNINGYTKTQYLDFFDNNNVYVYYQLATPTYTEITDTELKTQLEEFDDAQSYEGQTNINVDGILPTILNVKALENIFN